MYEYFVIMGEEMYEITLGIKQSVYDKLLKKAQTMYVNTVEAAATEVLYEWADSEYADAR